MSTDAPSTAAAVCDRRSARLRRWVAHRHVDLPAWCEPAESAVSEFVADGGPEVTITGGEPFLHPQLDDLVHTVAARVPVVVLTNAMTGIPMRLRATPRGGRR